MAEDEIKEYGKKPKRLVVKSIEDIHARLLVRLKQDRIKQHAFFVEFISGYINDDPLIRQWVDSNPRIKRSNAAVKIMKREDKNIKKMEETFNLDQKDIDGIFDMLEEEIGDL